MAIPCEATEPCEAMPSNGLFRIIPWLIPCYSVRSSFTIDVLGQNRNGSLLFRWIEKS
jgi:hypothetical protein